MPRKPKTHYDYCMQVCLLCLGKTKTMRPVTDNQRELINAYLVSGLSKNDDRLPRALCTTCRLRVSELPVGGTGQANVFDHSILNDLRPITRGSSICECLVCKVGRSNINTSLNRRPAVGRPSIDAKDKPMAIKLCSSCLSEVGPGKPHTCSPNSRDSNLQEIVTNFDPKSGEKLASLVLKKKMDETTSKTFSVAQNHGRPVRVQLFPDCQSPQQIEISDIYKIKTDLNLSTRKTCQLAKHLRVATSKRKLIEPGLKESLHNNAHMLDSIFSIGFENFTNDVKPVVFCSDIKNLVITAVEKRGVNIHERILFKVGIDSGGDFLKICLNIILPMQRLDASSHQKRIKYEDGVSPNQFKDSSVEKLFILALTPEKNETHSTISILWKLLNGCGDLESMGHDTTIAADLKMCNILAGLMSHSSSHPCTWCDIHR